MLAPQPVFASANATREFPAFHPRHATGAIMKKSGRKKLLQPVPNQAQALKAFAFPHLTLQFHDESKSYYLSARKATLPRELQLRQRELHGTNTYLEEIRMKQHKSFRKVKLHTGHQELLETGRAKTSKKH